MRSRGFHQICIISVILAATASCQPPASNNQEARDKAASPGRVSSEGIQEQRMPADLQETVRQSEQIMQAQEQEQKKKREYQAGQAHRRLVISQTARTLLAKNENLSKDLQEFIINTADFYPDPFTLGRKLKELGPEALLLSPLLVQLLCPGEISGFHYDSLGGGGSISIQDEVADALVALGPMAVEPLLKGLKDPEPVVRSESAQALGRIGDPKAMKALQVSLKDADENVRANAKTAIESMAAHKNRP